MRWKPALFALPVVAGIFLLSVVDLGGFSIGTSARSAMAAVLKDPLSVLSQRSPGERLGGALLQTKKARAKPSARTAALVPGVGGPTERVLANVRERRLEELDNLPKLLETPPGEEPLFGTLDNLTDAGAGGGNPDDTNPVWRPGFSDPLGNGDTLRPSDPPAAVPEPATWLTMIMGFFGVGLALRRGHRRKQERTAGSIR